MSKDYLNLDFSGFSNGLYIPNMTFDTLQKLQPTINQGMTAIPGTEDLLKNIAPVSGMQNGLWQGGLAENLARGMNNQEQLMKTINAQDGLFNSMMNNTKDFFKNAGLKEYGQLANLAGDLYGWKLKKGLYDEQIANSKQAREIAAAEKKRKDDFIRITSGNYYT